MKTQPAPYSDHNDELVRLRHRAIDAMTKKELRRVATILDREADCLDSYRGRDGKFTDHDVDHRRAHREHDEMRALAKKLRKYARTV